MTAIAALATAFAPFDAEMLVTDIAWANGRVAALKAFKASDEYTMLARDAWQLYPRMFGIAGGKTWYGVFNGSTADSVAAFMEKNAKARADKRNATIAAKLAKHGISEVGAIEFTRNTDGFNGVFVLEGVRVEVRTILAGGYNIQCLHARVLVYVNGKKA